MNRLRRLSVGLKRGLGWFTLPVAAETVMVPKRVWVRMRWVLGLSLVLNGLSGAWFLETSRTTRLGSAMAASSTAMAADHQALAQLYSQQIGDLALAYQHYTDSLDAEGVARKQHWARYQQHLEAFNARAGHFEERTRRMQRWANHLKTLSEGEAAP